jgi:hypothetical protein
MDESHGDAGERADDHHQQRRRPPHSQENEAGKRHAEIARCLDRRGPQRVIQGAAEDSNDRGIDAANGRLCADPRAQGAPERQRADEDQDAGKKDADQSQRGPGRAMRRGCDDGAQIRREVNNGPGTACAAP